MAVLKCLEANVVWLESKKNEILEMVRVPSRKYDCQSRRDGGHSRKDVSQSEKGGG
jgi:hypothetical protein